MSTLRIPVGLLRFPTALTLLIAVMTINVTLAQVPPSVIRFPDGINSIEIPFQRYRGWIIVHARINGHEERSFILDTGAPIALLGDTSANTKYGLTIAGQALVKGVGNQPPSQVPLATGVTFNLGGLEISNCMVAIGAGGDAIYGIDGVLGKYVFEHTVVQINWDTQKLTITRPENFHYEGEGLTLPIHMSASGHIYGEICLEKEGRKRFMKAVIDTGNRSSLKLDATGSQEFYKGEVVLNEMITGWGANGPEYGSISRIDVSLAGFKLPGVVASIEKEAAPIDEESMGNLGISILERFNLVIDFGKGHLILEKNKSFDEPFTFNRSGILLHPSTSPHPVVNQVIPGSPADEAGILVGDQVVSINDHTVDHYSTEEIDALISGKTTDSIRIQLLRNEALLVKTLGMRNLL